MFCPKVPLETKLQNDSRSDNGYLEASKSIEFY